MKGKVRGRKQFRTVREERKSDPENWRRGWMSRSLTMGMANSGPTSVPQSPAPVGWRPAREERALVPGWSEGTSWILWGP